MEFRAQAIGVVNTSIRSSRLTNIQNSKRKEYQREVPKTFSLTVALDEHKLYVLINAELNVIWSIKSAYPLQTILFSGSIQTKNNKKQILVTYTSNVPHNVINIWLDKFIK